MQGRLKVKEKIAKENIKLTFVLSFIKHKFLYIFKTLELISTLSFLKLPIPTLAWE